MKRTMLFAALFMSVAIAIPGYAGTAGSFDWFVQPISDYWNDDTPGQPPHGQPFMNLNDFDTADTSDDKYHMAEDWNSRDGSDEGDALYAIGDGMVITSQQTTVQDGYGNVVMIKHLLPNLSFVEVGYYHLKDVYVAVNQSVTKGQIIGTIGTGNGKYSPHLHIEVRKNHFDWNTDPYLKTLDIPTAQKYTSPSLFVDDRKYAVPLSLSFGAWTMLPWYLNAPSSTAYVEYNGERYSLPRAASAGLINQYVYVQISGAWYYYPDITKVVFNAGNTYAFLSYVPNASLTILVPGNHYKGDRAKIDMIRAVSGNPNFKSVKPDDFKLYSSDQSFDYSYMQFTYNSGSGDQPVYANQATLKSNPMVRYTTYYNPATGSWTQWLAVDQNVLY